MQNAVHTEQEASLILSVEEEAWVNNELKNLIEDGQLENVFDEIMENVN